MKLQSLFLTYHIQAQALHIPLSPDKHGEGEGERERGEAEKKRKFQHLYDNNKASMT